MNRSDDSRPLRRFTMVVLGAAAAALFGLPGADAGTVTRSTPAVDDAVPVAASLQAQANESFRARRYAEAYGRFAALADTGDAGSAWMALMLVSNGQELFGTEWSATPGQLRRWSTLAQRHAEQRSAWIVAHDRGE